MINQTQRNVLLGLGRMLEHHPDFRVGQLLSWAMSQVENQHGLYDVEDSELEDVLCRMIREAEERQPPTLEEQLDLAKSA